MPAPIRTPRRGAATARLLAVLVLLAALVGALVWLLGGTDRRAATATGPSERGAAQPSDELTGAVRDDERQSATELAPVSVIDGFAVRPGVRLAGVGKLEGRVLARESGAPVAGARVRLLDYPPAAAPFLERIARLAKLSSDIAEETEPVALAISAADGAFAFEGTHAGTYYIDARSAWHVPENPVRAVVAASGAGGPVDVWVRAGGRIVGRVLRPDGTPAPNARVVGHPGVLVLLRQALAGELVFAESHTDGAGRFALAGLPPGSGYEVGAVGKGFAVSHALLIDVLPGADTEVEVLARRGGTLTGRVLAVPPDGGPALPIAGAHVGAVPHGLRDLLFVEELLEQSHVVTGADGRYRVNHVPPGEASLVAWAPTLLPGWVAALAVADGGELTVPDIALEPAPLAGGRVVDGAGEPLSGVRVEWAAADLEDMELDDAFVGLLGQAIHGFEYPETDAEGRFAAGPFPGEPPHQIRFSKRGFSPENEHWSPDSGELEVVMQSGGSVEGIVMDAERAVPLASFSIHSEDRMDLVTGLPAGWNPFSGGQLVEDEGGRFRVESLEAGSSVELRFSAPGFEPQSVEVEVKPGGVTRGVIVRMSPAGEVRGRVVDESGAGVAGALVLVVQEGGSMGRGEPWIARGMADQAPGGVLGAMAALGLTGDAAKVTAPDGGFVLTEVPAGSVSVFAAHRDFAPGGSETFETEAGGSVEGIVVELTKGAEIWGRVTDRFDRPVPGTAVVAASPGNFDGFGVYQALSDAEGVYRMPHVLAGNYFLVASRGDEALHPLSFLGSVGFDLVTVAPGETKRHDLVDRSAGGCRVFGRVLDEGVPVEGGALMALAFDADNALGVEFKMAPVRAGGAYEFAGLAPGDYTLQYQNDGMEVQLDFEVPELPELRFDFALPLGRITGVVVDEASGEPVPSSVVTLRSLEPRESAGGLLGAVLSRQGGTQRSYTEDDGEFEFLRVPGGEYELGVQAPSWGPKQNQYAPAEPEILRLPEGARRTGLRLGLRPSLSVRGVVLLPDGSPAARARVRGWQSEASGGRSENARSGDDGSFELSSLGPHAYDLSARLDGYGEAWIEGVRPGDAGQGPVELRLTAGVPVRVIVNGPDGAPASGAVATLVSLRGSEARRDEATGEALRDFFNGERVTDAQGRVDLGLFAPGPYQLDVRQGSARATREVELLEGAPRDLYVDLE